MRVSTWGNSHPNLPHRDGVVCSHDGCRAKLPGIVVSRSDRNQRPASAHEAAVSTVIHLNRFAAEKRGSVAAYERSSVEGE
jgi:hypothetical protein